MARRFLLSVALLLPACGAAIAACGEGTHVFDGRLFVQDRGCLGTTSSVDVVEGEPPGRCAPVCLAQAVADGGRAVYVSSMCAPYPFGFDASGSDPLCPEALAAFARNDTCLVDGGSTHPATDAGANGDGG